ncbi:hypothetical protein CRD59_05675, partial [Bifidobacterium xylocopae]
GVGAGRAQSFAVGATGEVYAWGANNAGQLGDGGTTNRTTPTKGVEPAIEVTGVKFDGLNGAGVSRSSGGQWSVRTPAHAQGDVDVTVDWTLGRHSQERYTIGNGYRYVWAFNLPKAGSTAFYQLIGLLLCLASVLGALSYAVRELTRRSQGRHMLTE